MDDDEMRVVLVPSLVTLPYLTIIVAIAVTVVVVMGEGPGWGRLLPERETAPWGMAWEPRRSNLGVTTFKFGVVNLV